MDPTIYIIAAVVVTAVLAIISFLFKDRVAAAAEGGDGEELEGRRRAVPINRSELPAGGRNRRTAGGRLQRAREAAEEERQLEEEGSDEDELWDQIAQPSGKIGTKKRAKLEEKARKRAEREAMLQEREEQKERETYDEEGRKKEEKRREKLQLEKEEEARKKKEEKEKREYEEYLAMKADFVLEEEGQDATTDTEEADLLKEFINYIKTNKVVILEDVAAHFKLKTQAVINRLETLLQNEILTGVLDDRGKFIYITEEELNSVAKFIQQRGRVSIQELAESSNQLIRTKPLEELEATA